MASCSVTAPPACQFATGRPFVHAPGSHIMYVLRAHTWGWALNVACIWHRRRLLWNLLHEAGLGLRGRIAESRQHHYQVCLPNTSELHQEMRLRSLSRRCRPRFDWLHYWSCLDTGGCVDRREWALLARSTTKHCEVNAVLRCWLFEHRHPSVILFHIPKAYPYPYQGLLIDTTWVSLIN